MFIKEITGYLPIYSNHDPSIKSHLSKEWILVDDSCLLFVLMCLFINFKFVN